MQAQTKFRWQLFLPISSFTVSFSQQFIFLLFLTLFSPVFPSSLHVFLTLFFVRSSPLYSRPFLQFHFLFQSSFPSLFSSPLSLLLKLFLARNVPFHSSPRVSSALNRCCAHGIVLIRMLDKSKAMTLTFSQFS